MVKKIPRDHKGLYLSVPFTHGRQSDISEEYKPDIKVNLMSGKIEGEERKKERKVALLLRNEKSLSTRKEMSKFVLLSALCFTTQPCTKRDGVR